MMKAPEQKLVFQAFHERLGETLKKHGFVFRKNLYYRKNGRIFQAIGLDISSTFTHLQLTMFPYWATRHHSRPILRKSNVFLEIIENKKKWIYGHDLALFDRYDPPEKLFLYSSKEKNGLLDVLDQIDDEFSFCEITNRYFYHFRWDMGASVLFCALQEGSFDYAKKWLQDVERYCNQADIEHIVTNHVENNQALGPCFFKDYEGYLQWLNAQMVTKSLLQKPCSDKRTEYLIQQFEHYDANPAWKDRVVKKAREWTTDCMRINFAELKEIIDNRNFDWIKELYEGEAPFMQAFFIKHLNLDYSD